MARRRRPATVGLRSDRFFEFGEGKVSVGLSRDEALDPLVVLYRDPRGQRVGEVLADPPVHLMDARGTLETEHAVLVFRRVESVDVLIEALMGARRVLEAKAGRPVGVFHEAERSILAEVDARRSEGQP